MPPGKDSSTSIGWSWRTLGRYLGHNSSRYTERKTLPENKTHIREHQLLHHMLPWAWSAGMKPEDWAYEFPKWLSGTSSPGRGRRLTAWGQECWHGFMSVPKEWAPPSAQSGGVAERGENNVRWQSTAGTSQRETPKWAVAGSFRPTKYFNRDRKEG